MPHSGSLPVASLRTRHSAALFSSLSGESRTMSASKSSPNLISKRSAGPKSLATSSSLAFSFSSLQRILNKGVISPLKSYGGLLHVAGIDLHAVREELHELLK